MAETNYVPDPAEGTSYAELPGGDLGGGSGTGSGILQVFVDRAPAAPDDPSEAALSFPAGGGGLQQWDGTGWF